MSCRWYIIYIQLEPVVSPCSCAWIGWCSSAFFKVEWPSSGQAHDRPTVGFFHLVFHSGELSHLPSWVNDKYPGNPSSKRCPRVREVAHNSNDCWTGVIAIANEGYKPTNITGGYQPEWYYSQEHCHFRKKQKSAGLVLLLLLLF